MNNMMQLSIPSSWVYLTASFLSTTHNSVVCKTPCKHNFLGLCIAVLYISLSFLSLDNTKS